MGGLALSTFEDNLKITYLARDHGLQTTFTFTLENILKQ